MFVFICVLALSITTDVVQGQGYQFRPNVNGWIKSHRVAATWEEANKKCRSEDAELVAPVNEDLLMDIKYLIHGNNYSGQYLIDVRAAYVSGEFSSTGGVPLDRMPVGDMVQRLDREDGDCLSIDRHQIRVVSCDKRLPYFCYRQKQNDVMTECGTFDNEYVLNNSTGSCYKHHREELTWHEAYYTCVGEGGHLVIINDDVEAEAIYKMFTFAKAPYIGLQALKGDAVWTSIHGESVESIYNVWKYKTANNPYERTDPRYRCSVMFYDLELYPELCTYLDNFVCEKDPKIIQFPLSK